MCLDCDDTLKDDVVLLQTQLVLRPRFEAFSRDSADGVKAVSIVSPWVMVLGFAQLVHLTCSTIAVPYSGLATE